MKIINGNAGTIINMVVSGEIVVGEVVRSLVNGCDYRVEQSGDWIRLQEVA